MPLALILAPGDPTGIGPEITVKTLARLDEFADTHFIIVGSVAALESAAKNLGLPLPQNSRVRYQPIEADKPGLIAYKALDVAVRMISANEARALVTGPISKRNLKDAGVDFPGHTEILEDLARRHFGPVPQQSAGESPPPLGGSNPKGFDARRDWLGGGLSEINPPPAKIKGLLKQTPVFASSPQGGREPCAEMLFVYKNFRLLLLTRHIPLQDVPKALSKPGAVAGPLKTLIHFLRHQAKISEPKIALLGLNPHAGEIGGEEEDKFYQPVIRAVNAIGASRLEGPFAADGFFRGFDAENPGYDAVVAAYHDQGLIPFKLMAGYEAVNVTIGLPFLRTSVSHGTADDIAGKGTAREDSFIAAIHAAIRMS